MVEEMPRKCNYHLNHDWFSKFEFLSTSTQFDIPETTYKYCDIWGYDSLFLLISLKGGF